MQSAIELGGPASTRQFVTSQGNVTIRGSLKGRDSEEVVFEGIDPVALREGLYFPIGH